MFCPKCKYEYTDTVTKCPDCDENLVSAVEIEKIKNEEEEVKYDMLLTEIEDLDFSDSEYDLEHIEWIQIARLNSQNYADMLLEALHEKKIPAVIHSETGYFGFIGTLGPSSYAPIGGGYSLFVAKEAIMDVDEEAKILLGETWEKSKLVDIEIEN